MVSHVQAVVRESLPEFGLANCYPSTVAVVELARRHGIEARVQHVSAALLVRGRVVKVIDRHALVRYSGPVWLEVAGEQLISFLAEPATVRRMPELVRTLTDPAGVEQVRRFRLRTEQDLGGIAAVYSIVPPPPRAVAWLREFRESELCRRIVDRLDHDNVSLTDPSLDPVP